MVPPVVDWIVLAPALLSVRLPLPMSTMLRALMLSVLMVEDAPRVNVPAPSLVSVSVEVKAVAPVLKLLEALLISNPTATLAL